MNEPAISTGQRPASHTLVLGIGNSLLSDEGIGVHAVRRLHAIHGELTGVEWMDGGTLSFSLAPEIGDAAHLIVVDAAELHAAPGTIRVFVDDEMDRFLAAPGRRSVHEVGLIDLMVMARLAECLPLRRALIGIQPQHTGWGEQPTAPVADALPAVCATVTELLEDWK